MTKIIACQTIQDEILSILPNNVETKFLKYALHRQPGRLKEKLQEAINETRNHNTILLGYGLCSNSIAGLHSKDKTLVIPRVHDCISILLGSREEYNKKFRQSPGTIYLSKGWIDHGGDPYANYQDYAEQYDEETAQWIIEEEYKNYEQLVFINTEVGDLSKYKDYSRKVANYLDLNYKEVNGSLRMVEKLLNQDWDQDFITVPPEQMVIRNHFM
ncbi:MULTISPECIES: DUF1638 domain-containing protein [unclassified Candidatus Frackibacter]|uniref:DUF1638 domain-containing protein n=1 Tax=unclassified Candidatus Frackibacter TaxID=2648818 RepID=UPI00079132C3|nr:MULTISPECIES: DUF1638 domain-containing protein [unclassified Candidatus Frackibacter]KXS40424.1 MAG: hypothetical protein AWU54_1975 [Candidatus Frackibacter sp. T328-2]SDC37104.1 Protein of unknown function [Candidatus Frackibacter sp. WG11]SEM62887.1 Protein of unknown function [Candidatus Frackibacter sp. WG12]SFL64845.1 Protein of unknown function [Candidatus Frackibacter sp. WG13]